MLKSRLGPLKNNAGMAAIEIIPIFIVLLLLLSFTFGFFGAIHTGILNSIASRNYAFETFRHRSNLIYFKDTSGLPGDYNVTYSKEKIRFHGIGSEFGTNSSYRISKREIDKFKVISMDEGDSANPHNRDVPGITEGRRNSRVGVNRVWAKTTYGICIDSDCSD